MIIDTSQYKDKNDYYHSFKTLLGGQFKARLGSWVRLIIDPSQHKDKNNYCYNFKTQLRSLTGAKAQTMSWDGQPRLTQNNIKIKILIIIVLKPYSRVDLKQGLSYDLEGSTWVDPN